MAALCVVIDVDALTVLTSLYKGSHWLLKKHVHINASDILLRLKKKRLEKKDWDKDWERKIWGERLRKVEEGRLRESYWERKIEEGRLKGNCFFIGDGYNSCLFNCLSVSLHLCRSEGCHFDWNWHCFWNLKAENKFGQYTGWGCVAKCVVKPSGVREQNGLWDKARQ